MTFIALVAPIYVNVKNYGAVCNGTTDDTSAVNAAISASNDGDTIYFPGICKVSSTIVVPGYRTLLGEDSLKSGLIAASGSNLDAVLCSSVWPSTTATTCDFPITIEHFSVTGEGTGQASGLGNGIVLVSYQSLLNDVVIANCKNDGLLFSANRKDGTVITNTMVENHCRRVVVRSTGGRGIHVADTSFNKATDGWLEDCIIDTSTKEGILIESSAGWLVSGCHMYTCSVTAINLGRPLATRVVENYIEPFGKSSTSGSYYGIAFGDGVSTFIGASGPSVATGNIIIMDPAAVGNAGTFLAGINTNCSNGVVASIMLSANNIFALSVNAIDFAGIIFSNQGSTSTTNASLIGNLVTNITTPVVTFPQSGVMNVTTEDTGAGTPVVIPSTTAAATATSGTISTVGVGEARIAPTAAVTGIILQSGTMAGQTVTIVNESAFTVTFAASGTSHVADGVANIIPPNSSRRYIWDSLWYGQSTAPVQSSSAVATAGSGTIATAGLDVSRVAPTAAVTGVILAAGTYAGQSVIVVNEATTTTFSVTFAASGTSNVANGVTEIIPGLCSRRYVWDSGTSLWYSVNAVPMQSATAVSTASSGTIATAGLDVSRVTTSGAITAVILAVGTYAGQSVTVINESANTVTFATSATSHVASGTSATVQATAARRFVWDSSTSLWYQA